MVDPIIVEKLIGAKIISVKDGVEKTEMALDNGQVVGFYGAKFYTPAEVIAMNNVKVQKLELERQVMEQKAIDARKQALDLEKKWLVDTLSQYWSGTFVLPTTEGEWMATFHTYIYDEPNLQPYIPIPMDDYYQQKMDEVAAAGGTLDAYFDVFLKMTFTIEAELPI